MARVAETLVSVSETTTIKQNFVTILNEEYWLCLPDNRFKTGIAVAGILLLPLHVFINRSTRSTHFYKSPTGFIDQLKAEIFAKLIQSLSFAIRSSKITRPGQIANNGSFFLLTQL